MYKVCSYCSQEKKTVNNTMRLENAQLSRFEHSKYNLILEGYFLDEWFSNDRNQLYSTQYLNGYKFKYWFSVKLV